MTGPLAGLRVLDLSRVLAGPWASQFFADMGADVIKVEKPGHGDDTRQWGPPWMQDDNGADTGESAYFLSCNRGKRSVTADISSAEGQALVKRIASQSDVLIENFKVDGLRRYGLDFASLHALNPKLIYCSITGFGQSGPNAHRPGYDAMIQAEAGLMSLTGDPDGPPMKTGVAVVDLSAGMYAAASVLAALYSRTQSGIGQHIDIALHDVQVAGLAYHGVSHLLTGQNPARHGNAHPNIVPYQAFAVADGHLMLSIGNDGQFRSFCRVAGLDELAKEPRFARNTDRVAHRKTLLPILERAMLLRSLHDWRIALDAAGVPCGPVNTLDQVMGSDQVAARRLVQSFKHPLRNALPLVGNPVKFSATPLAPAFAPPLLGQHTQAVMQELDARSAADTD